MARAKSFLAAHKRLVAAAQLAILVVFLGSVGWAVRGSFHAAGRDLRDADPWYFVFACLAVAAYYLVFVVGWIWILREWGYEVSYPGALRAEMVSMLAKYVPGGVWTPAARVVAMRRVGVTDGALVTAAMLLEAGLSAVSGVIVLVISLAWVSGVDAPIAPLVAFGVVIAVLVQPRVFRPLSSRILRRFGRDALPPVRGRTMAMLLTFYCGTWVVGGTGLWLLLRSVHAHPRVSTIVFLGGTAAAGAIVAVLAVFAPSGLGAREASMYGMILAIAPQGAALGATVLNRVAITLVEALLFAIGSLVLRQVSVRPTASRQPATSADTSAPGS
ncbi:MAG TPA: lysylphosphatidylglycerol synthase transmembrane domain-containing protein [Gaiellaceae bacterium]|nr:lysylphosphatidylglycerol synthase transmembrane domain-containing protein [Gaiellaceae bacterium]